MATGIPLNKIRSNDENFTIEYKNKMPVEEILDLDKSNIKHALSIDIKKSLDDWRNRLYYGDNLEILLNLVNDENVRGKVKLIYIDPPYGTNCAFVCREQKEAYIDNLVGAKFLEFLRKRLILLRELLADDGSIYVHLDEKMAFPVKIIMDEIFGSKNYRNFITRQKCNRKNSTSKKYGNISDYIMFYTKSNKYTWNRAYEPWSEEDMKKQYPCIDEETGRRYKKVPIHAPGIRNGETGKEWRGMMPPKGKHWQYLPSKLDEFDAKGEIYWSATGNPRRKVFFDNSDGIAVQDIWLDTKDIINQNDKITGYPTEKHINLLNRIVMASSNENDIVLDCFSGSGTTLVSAELNNRKWIGIDCGLHAIETTIKRFAYGSKIMGDYVEKNKSNDNEEKQLLLKTNMDIFYEEDNIDILEHVTELKDMFKKG